MPHNAVKKTLELLTDTPNEAAVSVLLAALDSSDREIQEGALRALLSRRRGSGQQELVRRWNTLNERWKWTIAQHPRQISAAVRHAILSTNSELCANGCDALLRIREYELMPALATAALDPANPQASLVAETLLQLAELLYEEIAGPRDEFRRQDPERVRHQVLPALQEAVDRYEHHALHEMVEAFLLLTPRENPVLKTVLREPRHPAYLVVLDILGHSSRLGIIRLVLNFLEDRFAPSAALQVVAHRCDLTFVRQLLHRIGVDPPKRMRANLRRIESIAWLTDNLPILDTLTDEEQRVIVQLVVASGMNRLEVFEILKHLLKHGREGGRRAASAAMAQFGGAEANQLALGGLDDPDPEVQANMVSQLRERGIPGAISRLIQTLDSPHEIVRNAARDCLTEFSFARYVSSFDMMDDEVRRNTGSLVMRIDDSAVPRLAGEFKTPTRTRRLRALEIAVAMDAVPHVEALVIGLLGDDDHFVRAEAARVLATCDTPMARQALREALMDRSVAVREAAEEAIRQLIDDPRKTAPAGIVSKLHSAEFNPLTASSPPAHSE